MKTHRFDPLSFVMGLIVTAIGLTFLIPYDPIDIVDLVSDVGAWFWPVVLLAIGVAILVPALTPRREDDDQASG